MPSRRKSLLSRLTIRNQLMLLTILFLGGFAHFSYLAYDTLLTLKVNGPYYDRVIQSKDLIADVLPHRSSSSKHTCWCYKWWTKRTPNN